MNIKSDMFASAFGINERKCCFVKASRCVCIKCVYISVG